MKKPVVDSILTSFRENFQHGFGVWRLIIRLSSLIFFSFYFLSTGKCVSPVRLSNLPMTEAKVFTCVARLAYEEGLKALSAGKTFGDVCEAMHVPLTAVGCWNL